MSQGDYIQDLTFIDTCAKHPELTHSLLSYAHSCLAVLRTYHPPLKKTTGVGASLACVRARSPSSPALAPRVPPWPGTKAPVRPPPPPERR
eukprot:scaffold63316_cov31-Phaeocystis_antarctica.AAC.1